MKAAASTREKLLDAAARLYAERGVFNVSLAEIVREAGQRNPSAILYHFGSRDDMLLAFLEPHVRFIRERRLELYAEACATADDDLRSPIEALVRPVTELAARGWRERAYLQIGLELADHRHQFSPAIGKLVFDTANREVFKLLAKRCPRLPPELWEARVLICTGFVARAAAERARAMDAQHSEATFPLDDDAFVSNLIDMYLGALTSPVSLGPTGPFRADLMDSRTPSH